ncbi:hypothetical protein EVAR_29426_1 [Eumeta japonica]|uniref:Uncharacterized protein n=1 Tax=Eumeta variegata TaxID=151549 RepID=A0A4C1VTN4_EUMVA|nr:hypothetical protein EVAR_29426_1 [Eumeta japonica]
MTSSMFTHSWICVRDLAVHAQPPARVNGVVARKGREENRPSAHRTTYSVEFCTVVAESDPDYAQTDRWVFSSSQIEPLAPCPARAF